MILKLIEIMNDVESDEDTKYVCATVLNELVNKHKKELFNTSKQYITEYKENWELYKIIFYDDDGVFLKDEIFKRLIILNDNIMFDKQ